MAFSINCWNKDKAIGMQLIFTLHTCGTFSSKYAHFSSNDASILTPCLDGTMPKYGTIFLNAVSFKTVLQSIVHGN